MMLVIIDTLVPDMLIIAVVVVVAAVTVETSNGHCV
jgi:hypothetical protein